MSGKEHTTRTDGKCKLFCMASVKVISKDASTFQHQSTVQDGSPPDIWITNGHAFPMEKPSWRHRGDKEIRKSSSNLPIGANKHTNQQTGKKQYVPHYSGGGHKK
ncbi:hypothetical protein DPMN_052989 [Dreissena polymorpha]|uniref:Uncharacterized protein n=1 Tax=Dreissena polymorpha TaxID=45954 RepID=A0A9D4HRR3_DREPO|nr:hypothetical protein DPMN_052989 [Dreissena polymorpha]